MRRNQTRDESGPGWEEVVIGIAVATVVVAFLSIVVGIGSQPASAANTTINDTAPMYENTSQNVSTQFWFPTGNVTLDSLGDMVVRVGPAIIGTGEQDPSGTGYQGALLTALFMSAAGLVAVLGTGVGPVGGTIVASVIGFGMTTIGLAPEWFEIILLFAIGIAATKAALDIFNS